VEEEGSRNFRQVINLPNDCRASWGRKPEVWFEGAAGEFLNAKGIFIDYLTYLTLDTYEAWREFKSRTGLIVVTTKLAQQEDEIWVLYGASSPFVLRREGRDYILVGEAMIWSGTDFQQRAPIVRRDASVTDSIVVTLVSKFRGALHFQLHLFSLQTCIFFLL
jgi:hypothetical protein